MMPYIETLAVQRQGASDRGVEQMRLMGRRKSAELRRVAEERGWLDKSCPMPTLDEVWQAMAPKPQAKMVSLAKPHEEFIRQCIARGLKTMAIFKLMKTKFGFEGSYDSVRRFVVAILAEGPKATVRMEFAIGEAAQADFGKAMKLLDPETGEVRQAHFISMVLCHSRYMHAELIFRQDQETWQGFHIRAFRAFGGVPRQVIVDNCKVAITKPDRYHPVPNKSSLLFAEAAGFLIAPCPVRTPQQKGRVESSIKYLRSAFEPMVPENCDIHVANRILGTWLREEAGERIHGTIKRKPWEVLQEERPFLGPLPESLEPTVWTTAKLAANCHVTVRECFYSAPARFLGRTLDVAITEREVRLYSYGELAAVHPRLHVPGTASTVKEHYPPKGAAAQLSRGVNLLKAAREVGPHCERVMQGWFGMHGVSTYNACHGLLGLVKKYGAEQVERGCAEALSFVDLDYPTVFRCVSTPPAPPPPPSTPPSTPKPMLRGVYKAGTLFQRNVGKGQDGKGDGPCKG
jgi:transposase